MRYEINKLVRHPDYHRMVFYGAVSPCGRFVDVDERLLRPTEPLPLPVAPEPEPMPQWAKLIAAHALPGERGVGDTAERLFGALGGSALKGAMRELLGVDCGCEARRDDWNRRWPYKKSVDAGSRDAVQPYRAVEQPASSQGS